jgi:hypothetical protein
MKQDDLLIKFMKVAIDKINRSLANNYAIEQVLIEKGIVTQKEMIEKIHDAENLPERKVGTEVLQQMMEDFNAKAKERSNAR